MEQLPFCELINSWFSTRLGHPTPIQEAAWPKVQSGLHCLICAGTGQGKTLAAFLPILNRLLTHSNPGRVLYVAPLKALSKNMAESLQTCLNELRQGGARGLTVGLRVGDTSAAERRAQLRTPPDVLLTTPESLFVLLGSHAGRRALSQASSVVIDELHALSDCKRGAHLSLSLARLDQICLSGPVQRLGLSATARPLARVARFLVGPEEHCEIVTAGISTDVAVRMETGPFPLSHVAGQKRWEFIGGQIAGLAENQGRGLVFCNTRALVERLAADLAERMGADRVGAHHGSLGYGQRNQVEAGLRLGQVDVVVCSSSLELGIDVGNLSWVAQIGSVDSVSAARQRAGRSRHSPGLIPALHLFPLTLSDLLNGQALLHALQRRRLEPVRNWQRSPADVLCQQVIAMASVGSLRSKDLSGLLGRCAAYESLRTEELGQIIDLMHDGFVPARETGRGPIRRGAAGRIYPAPDAARRSRRNVGTIPEWFDYEVVEVPTGALLGRLDEEFAFESSPGQIIQLGGDQYRIERVRSGRVEVTPADENHAELPFWTGDGAGRSMTLSMQVCRILRCAEERRLAAVPDELRDLLRQSLAVLGRLPGAHQIILERFPDPGGDEHLVIHAPFGLRINRAWGLALRKRFCRQFNFELQAVASDNAVLISLGATHSFALEDVIGYLRSDTLESVLTQAILDTPEFATRFRWCATTALAIEKRDERGRVSAQLQRNQAENLIARTFPDQLACLENLSGPRQVPDHPLVLQALHECLYEFMDLQGLRRLYRRIESGRLFIHCVQTPHPSPLAQTVIHAQPSGFLDEAEAEERRTRSFERPLHRPRSAERKFVQAPVCNLSQPEALEQALQHFTYMPAAEGELAGAALAFRSLSLQGAVFALKRCKLDQPLWVHLDHVGAWLSLDPEIRLQPHLPKHMHPPLVERDEALKRIVLGAIRRRGQVTEQDLQSEIGQGREQIQSALLALQAEGLVRLSDGAPAGRWVERSVRRRPLVA
ncbi:MAG: DEAD/DEAH box helicase [Wenzhouxiangella sp.]|jgi:ATP-dependent Lhr-like helicase|nr:DEAD/DEAH box helicase [Wenzhouxiangella sp.]